LVTKKEEHKIKDEQLI